MKDSVVIDASLACLWVMPEQHTERAFALARRWVASGSRLIAPCLMLTEVTNAVYKRIRRKEMDLTTARQALQIVMEFDIEICEEPGFHERAIELADAFKMPTTYDAHYLALAERYTCPLWTADKKLYDSVRRKLPWVRWVGHLS